MLSEQECAEHLAYTDWDRYKIAKDVLNAYIKQAPFTNQLYHDERVRRMEQKLKDLKIYLAPEALKKAQAQYRQAIQKAPSDWRLRWKYGKLLAEDLKDYRAAAEQYRLFLEHIPHSYTGCTALGQVLVKLGDIDGAIAQYREAIRIKSGKPIPHYFLAQVYRKQGRTDKAIEYYSKTLQILPTHVDAYFNLGLTYQTQGRLDKAIEQYSEALRLRPNHAKAHNNLAISLYQQSKLKEAVQTYRRGLLVVPDDLKLHYNLAILLEKQGHKNEAIKELRAALQIDPNSIEVRKMLEDMLKRGY
ncbi:Beta-barrel assembly-enhancing protease [subsurface metagenome]